MVQISEISDNSGNPPPAGPPEPLEGRRSEAPQLSPAASAPEATQIVEKPVTNASSSGQTHYNEYAMRVAYIMRSYLSMSQSTPSLSAGERPTPACDRCKAMMEVVRKESGNWTISKIVTEHNHEFSPACAAVPSDAAPPAVGMVFDSAEAARDYYYGYSERMGFKPRTGSNRRSAGTGDLIMQRFLCWRGSYLMCKRNFNEVKRKAKRGISKRRSRKPKEAGKGVKDGDAAGVVPAESSKKRGVAGDDTGGEVQTGALVKKSVDAEEDMGQKVPALANGSGAATSSTGGGMEKGAGVPQVTDSAQSKLLRALGVRVYRYTEEERRDIIMKYTMKRNNRLVIERPMKVPFFEVPSRQTKAESHQRATSGSFHTADKLQTSSGQEVTTAAWSDALAEDAASGGEPKVGMAFANEDRAYEFYVRYAGNIGFSVRKGWWDKTARSVTRSRVYVCSREGFRPKNLVNEAKRPRPETRTGCPAHMAIKITSDGKYSVNEFVPEHNHELSTPLNILMLKSQRLLTKVPLRDSQNASLIPASYKNYLRSKRAKDMLKGDARAVVEYLQKMKGDNPSFFYAIQVDEDDQLTNIFWADAKSMMDYYYFGDVVCFDTTYKSNDYSRPFAQFIGVNHHKQMVFFGAALVYDESIESFKWLFETFKAAMSGKQPKTILTDNCLKLSDTIAAVWPGTDHRFCVWHIYHNSTKHLSHIFESSETFSHDFSICIYDCEDEEEGFLSAWKTMLEKYDLKDNEWLAKLFEERKKWALVYGREIFCADMKSTLRNENFCSVLKECLKPEVNLLNFFEQYEKLIDERRYAELYADYHVSQGTYGIPPLPLIWQASSSYTPTVFLMFRMEFELFTKCMLYGCGDVGTVSEYVVTCREKTKEHFVRYDSADGTITCSCKKFEFIGIQCCHVLKVLDSNNIKELSPKYILKRWRKDAKAGSIQENHEFVDNGDPKSSLSKRYSSLCRILYKIAAKAADNVDAYTFLESQSDQILEQVERILQSTVTEKPHLNTSTKGQPQYSVQIEGAHQENSSESGRKRKDGGACRRHQSPLEMNKRQKGRKRQSGDPRVIRQDKEPVLASDTVTSHTRNPSNQFFAPSQFMQAPYVPAHQFGLGSIQSFHGMNQLTQDSSASALHQQPYNGSSYVSQNAMQACSVAPDMNPLQFAAASNPQLNHQDSDQGHYTIPVWDFL